MQRFFLRRSTSKGFENGLLKILCNRRLHSSITPVEREDVRRIDWTEHEGIVAPIRKQQEWPTCWAFQIDAALSSLYYMRTKKTLVFSPQELIDFGAGSKPGTISNRIGGNLVHALNWVKKYGLSLEKDYPYIGPPSTPRLHSGKRFYIDNIGFVPEFREDLLRRAVTYHPISAAILMEDSSLLEGHREGIMRPRPREGRMIKLNVFHAVQIVGFDEFDGHKVWKLKNSYGEKWGENGFFYVSRDVDPYENFFLALEPVYPILNGVNHNIFPDVTEWSDMQGVRLKVHLEILNSFFYCSGKLWNIPFIAFLPPHIHKYTHKYGVVWNTTKRVRKAVATKLQYVGWNNFASAHMILFNKNSSAYLAKMMRVSVLNDALKSVYNGKKHRYVGDFEYVDDHRAGKIVVELNGVIIKCGVISPRFDMGVKEIEGWNAKLLPSRQFFEYGSTSRIKELADQLTGHVLTLSLQMCGCQVILKHVLENGKPHERSAIINKLIGQIVQMSQQKFASNVVEKCATFGTPEERQMLVNEMLGSIDQNELLQFFEHGSTSRIRELADQLTGHVLTLSLQIYGCQVILKHVLENGKPHEHSAIINKLIGQIVQMSQQKFASNVIGKCVTFGTPEERQMLVNEMLGSIDQNELLQVMMIISLQTTLYRKCWKLVMTSNDS